VNRILFVLLCLYISLIVIFDRYGLYSYIPLNDIAQVVLVEQKAEDNTLTHVIKGRVLSFPESGNYYTTFFVYTHEIDGKTTRGNVLARIPSQDSVNLSYGDDISIECMLRRPVEALNPGQFDYSKYLAYQNVYCIASVIAYSKLDGYKHAGIFQKQYYLLMNWLNTNFEQSIKNAMPVNEAGVMGSIIVGKKSWLEPETRTIFMDAGVMHVLVVSGSNVAVIAGMFMWILHFLLRIPRRTAVPAVILIIAAYCVLTGSNPPVVRATVMTTCFLLTLMLRREISSYQVLLLSCWAMVLYDPKVVLSSGFQMSIAATFGILAGVQKCRLVLQSVPAVLRDVVNVLMVSVSAQMFVWPLIAVYFYKFSVICIISNLIVVPLSGLVLSLGLGLVGIHFVGGILYVLFGKICTVLTTVLIQISAVFAAVPYANVTVNGVSPEFLLCYYLALMIFVFFDIKKTVYFCVIAGMLLFTKYAVVEAKGRAEITFLSVGNGDSIVIKLPGGKAVLIDGGGNWDSALDPGEKIVVPFLNYKGLRKIDLLVLTHPHYNHYLGLRKVMDSVRVESVLLSYGHADTDEYSEFYKVCQSKAKKVITAVAGTEFVFSDAKFRVLNPGQSVQVDPDENSIVMEMQYHNFSGLFSGDIGEVGQESILQEINGRKYGVVQMPGHGVGYIAPEIYKLNTELFVVSGNGYATEYELGTNYGVVMKTVYTKQCGAVTVIIDKITNKIFYEFWLTH